MMKSLVAFISASGVTASVAVRLARGVGAELYEIAPETPYTNDDLNWMDKSARSTVEMRDETSRPPLQNHDAPVKDYDVIFVGFPIWWYREPSIINTFLEAYDFAGKTVIPFATSGGSGLGKAPARMGELSKATILPGRVFPPKVSERELKDWVRTLPL
ncbi:MAG: NAD(P)H-dependent oxidoreductase [Clostridia bacterium]|nr:NAD(P)H-dependent oxidoreductase [Clostridia bacterium]